jgi:trk system potassium uptake protein TrkA
MKRYAVIGLSNFGFHVTRALFEEGNEVVAIDMNKDRIQEVSPYTTEAIVQNATNKEALKSLGLPEMDGVVVSTGTKISTSILICFFLQELGVSRIIVKAVDEDHEKILRRVGASEIIHPERDMAKRLASSLSHPNIMDFIPLSDEYNIIQVSPPEEFIGKTLSELNLRKKYNVNVIAIKRMVPDESFLIPSADFVIQDTDVLLILGRAEDIRKIRALK